MGTTRQNHPPGGVVEERSLKSVRRRACSQLTNEHGEGSARKASKLVLRAVLSRDQEQGRVHEVAQVRVQHGLRPERERDADPLPGELEQPLEELQVDPIRVRGAHPLAAPSAGRQKVVAVVHHGVEDDRAHLVGFRVRVRVRALGLGL